MRNLLQRLLLLVFLFGTLASVNAQTSRYYVKYNICNNNYEARLRIITPYVTQLGRLNVGTCGFGIVVPASAPDGSLNIISYNGGSWYDPSQVNAPTASPTNDFHKAITAGAAIFGFGSTVPAGTDILLFTFTFSDGQCYPVRMFQNYLNNTNCTVPQWDDPFADPCSAIMTGGGDYRNSFKVLVPAAESYVGNLFNTGTLCSTGTPQGLNATGVTASGATLNWNFVSGADSYKVEYKENSSSTWIIAATATANLSQVLSGLTQGTLYDYRITANYACTTAVAATAQFTTSSACGTPSGLSSGSVTTTSATVSWSALGGANDYTVEYKPQASGTWTSAGTTASTSMNLSGLSSSTAYDWRVTANCNSGSGTPASAQFTTLTPCGTPSSVLANNITINSALLNWTAVAGAISYNVEYKESSTSTWLSAGAATTNTNFSLTGLQSTTTYDWRVTVNCASGVGDPVGSQFTTLTPCGTPSGLFTSNITPQSATLNWSAVSGANYRVEYKANESSTWTLLTAYTTNLFFNLTGLSSGTVYDWRVYANCISGSSEPVASQFTSAIACGTPTGLTTTTITSSSADLAWDAVPGALNYSVEYKQSSSSTWLPGIFANPSTTFTLTGLDPNTLYDWRLTANCAAGGGTPVISQFTTLVPCATATGLSSGSITVNSAVVSWSAVAGASSYAVEYKASTSGTWISAGAATTNTSLSLSGLTNSTTYDWRVTVNCPAGGGTPASAQFVTLTPCGTPSALTASSITTNSATVSWAAASGADSYTVEYKANSSSTWLSAGAPTTSLSMGLTGLAATTLYDWRVTANCAAGGGVAASQFTTLTPCVAPTGLNTTAISSNSATVNWTAVPSASSYQVEYKANTSGTWITVAAATTSLSQAITGLTQATLYDWRVTATCPSGVGPSSAAQFTTTLNCGNPTGLNTTAITATSATMNWTAVPGATSYRVEYKANSSTTWLVSIASTTSLSRTQTGLAPSTLYDWRVTSTCAAGTGLPVASQFTTALACGNPGGLNTTAITATSATMNWLAVSGATSYRVEYKANNSSTWLVSVASTTTLSRTQTGLVPNTLYDWRVTSTCAAGVGNPVAAQFTTLVACGNPSGLNTTGLGATSVTLNWLAVSGATGYRVEYKANTSSTWVVATASTTALLFNLTGLTPSTLYDWRITATCSAGPGSPVASQFTTTAICPEAYEPNNSLGAATPISTGVDYRAQLSVSSDKDYYAFNNSSMLPNIRVTLTNVPLDYNLQLFSPSGKVVATSAKTGTQNELIAYKTTVTGTYKAYVYSNKLSNTSSCYTLRVDIGSTPFAADDSTIYDPAPAMQQLPGNDMILKQGGVRVYPVPANNKVTISFDGDTKASTVITLLDQYGNAIIRKNVTSDAGINFYDLDVSRIAAGMYTLRLQTGDRTDIKKVMVVH